MLVVSCQLLVVSLAFGQVSPDTVNGWYVDQIVGAVNAASSRIVSDTAMEGEKSQVFRFDLENNSSVEWEKQYSREYRNPSFLKVYVRMRSFRPPPTPWIVSFYFSLQHGDTIRSVQSADIWYPEQDWAEIYLDNNLPGTDTLVFFDKLRLRFDFNYGSGSGGAEIFFDDLLLYYWNGTTADSIIQLDRFGDDVPPPPTPQFAIEPRLLDFDSILVGNEKVDSALVRNSGTDTLLIASVASDASEFTVCPFPSSVAPGDSAYAVVTFRPTAVGAVGGNIIFTHNASTSPDTLCVFGVGTAITGVADGYQSPVMSYELSQNYPNPFNP
ncbi:MAG: choice-of-anchor D domain-containing protein, partial [Bacteroidota bacterium]